MIEARRATDSDYVELVRLDQRAREGASLERGGKLHLLRDARPGPDEKSLRDDLDNAKRLVLIGSIGGSPVGFATATLVPLLDGYLLCDISEIFVEPEARDVGVGECLMREVLRWATENGCDGIDARALPGDRSTKNFFESHGIVARGITVHRELRTP